MKSATALIVLVSLASLGAGAEELPFLRPTVEYSGTRVMDTAQGRMEQKLYSTPKKVRTETNFQGMTVTNIMRLDLGVMWITSPGMPTCMEQPLDQIEADMGMGQHDALSAADVEYRKLGEETIGGIETTRYEVVSKDKGETHRALFWVTDENIPVKMQVEPSADGSDVPVTMTLENLKIGPNDPALFESPGQCMRMPAMPGMPGMPQMPPAGSGRP